MSATYDEQYYRESVTVAPKTPPKHEYRTEDVTVTMEVFRELTGPLPLLIFDRPGARIAIEITAERRLPPERRVRCAQLPGGSP